MNMFKSHKQSLIVLVVLLVVSLASAAAVCIIGLNYPEFVSAASPVLPIERLAGMPANSIALPITELIFGLVYLFINISNLKKEVK